MPFKYPSLEDRIIANSVLSDTHYWTDPLNGETTPCWEWIGPKRGNSAAGANDGYPMITLRWKSGPRKGQVRCAGAHRISLIAFKGRRLGAKQVARHLCNNKNCVNPLHLEGGSVKQNNKDTVKAGHHGNGYRAPVRERKARERANADYASLGADSRSVHLGARGDRQPLAAVEISYEEELVPV